MHRLDPYPRPWHVLISGGLAVGGPQTHVTLLCRVLREAGADVTIAAASTNWPRQAIAELEAMGVRVVVSPFGYGSLRALGKAWAFIAWPILLRRDYDVVYCVGEGRMHLWAARFARPQAWKIYHEIVQAPGADSATVQMARQMDAIIANSRTVAEGMERTMGHLPIRTIPFFTVQPEVELPQRKENGPELRVAFLGRLAPHKRPLELIEAWPRLTTTMGPARLDLYGGDYDNEGRRLQERIDALGLRDVAKLHGAYSAEDMMSIFANTDIVVLPSKYEGLPLVLVEAMHRGVPVVATSAGGTAELGDDNPDVIISEGIGWENFETSLIEMARRVRAGEIDGPRLQRWTETRYGFAPVAAAWREALLQPDLYFAEQPIRANAAAVV
jgi:glycosyltransferase involved in cell wall biosynthesis